MALTRQEIYHKKNRGGEGNFHFQAVVQEVTAMSRISGGRRALATAMLVVLLGVVMFCRPGVSEEGVMPQEGGAGTGGPESVSLPTEAQELIKAFKALLNKPGVPSDAGDFIRYLLDQMQEAARGKEPYGFRPDQGKLLFDKFDALMGKQGLPSEATDIFKSFRGLLEGAQRAPRPQQVPPERDAKEPRSGTSLN